MLGQPANHADSTLRNGRWQSWCWLPGHGWLSAWQLLACQAKLTLAFIIITRKNCLHSRALPLMHCQPWTHQQQVCEMMLKMSRHCVSAGICAMFNGAELMTLASEASTSTHRFQLAA
jgi:hypothetical protein